jgi:outer membrane protein assembly factor BamB
MNKKKILIMLLGVLIIILNSCIPEKSYKLNITIIGSGTYSVDPEKDSYKIGESIKIKAIPNEGYSFSHWSGDVESTDNPLTITSTKDINIKAYFVLKEYNLNITTDGNGSYSVEPDKELYKHGESATLTAVANDNYVFSHWSGDVESTDNPLNITITKNTGIQANFGSVKWSEIPDKVVLNNEKIEINLDDYATNLDGEQLSYEIISGPGSITDNMYSYTPINESGNKEIIISAKQDNGYSSQTSFDIYVNIVPKWKTIPEQTAYINETFKLDLLEYATDTKDDSLDIILVSGPGNITDNIYSYDAEKEGNNFQIKVRAYDKYNYYSDTSFTIETLVKPSSKIWAFTAGDSIYSSPAIGNDGTIYVGSRDGKLYAVNPDGTKKWAFTAGDSIYSSPAIGSDGTIYVGSLDHNLYAINPDGTKKWAFKTDDFVNLSPAIGSDGTIYIGSYDNKLYAINPNGTKKWAFKTGSYTASPAIGSDDTIYVGSGDYNLYAINQDGTKKWTFTAGHEIRSSPAIGNDGTIYFGSHDRNLYAINPDGTKKWTFKTGNLVISSPAIGNDGTIYFGSYDDNLYAINPKGIKKWSFKTGDYIDSSPSIGTDGVIYVGSGDHNLYAIEGKSGGLADTPWPKFGKNNKNTGNFNDSE